MLRKGSLLFFISIILGFKFEIFRYIALGIVAVYVLLVPYYFIYLKTCRNCGAKNQPNRKTCSCCGEENWKQR